MSEKNLTITVQPVSLERWPDLQKLFGTNGAYAGCWCMFWRLPRSRFKEQKYEGNKAEMHHLLQTGAVPGLLAYDTNEPIGWCSLGPREQFHALENSRLLKRMDDQPVWSITCFFIARGYRNQGVMTQLLQGAVTYAGEQGAGIVEAYPIDIQQRASSPGAIWGLLRPFAAWGL